MRRYPGARPTDNRAAWPWALTSLVPEKAAHAVAAETGSFDGLARAFRARGPGAVVGIAQRTATGQAVGPSTSGKLCDFLTKTNPEFVTE